MNEYLNLRPRMDWASASRLFATTKEVFDAQPNYENEVVLAQDTRIKYQGVASVVGGWVFADGRPGPFPFPPDPPALNDGFTKLLLDFEGLEGSTTYYDTNAAGWPRKWTQVSGFGHITNVDELFDDGSLYLDGHTVIIAPDSVAFDFRDGEFTVRGWFRCDFPLGEGRTLVAKTDNAVQKKMFWVDRLDTGEIIVWAGTTGVIDLTLQERDADQIFDRNGQPIFVRVESIPPGPETVYSLQSVTKYSDTLNPGWHQFLYQRKENTLSIWMDAVQEDTQSVGGDIGVEMINYVPGPITIGGYGPPRGGQYVGGSRPWRGGFDRFAVDIGIARL